MRSKIAASLGNLRRGGVRNPRVVVRGVLGALLLANVIAALLVLRPWGGTPDELDARLSDMRRQIQQRQSTLVRLRAVTQKVQSARTTGDDFLAQHFTDQRTAYSTLLEELGRASKESGIKQREHTIAVEPVEGSDTIAMMTVTANYEGSYADLLRFVNELDRSTRFLIMESLRAAPQQSGALSVSMKLNTFVRSGA